MLHHRFLGAVAVVLVFSAGPVLGARVAFSDQTASAALRHTPGVYGDVQPPHRYFSAGATVGDFNNDGWPDIFLLGCGVVADALYINNRNGTFTDRAAAWGVAAIHRGSAATAADFDGDGWQDLYVTGIGDLSGPPRAGQHRLYRNNRNGTFTDVAASAGINRENTKWEPEGPSPSLNPESIGIGDYDLDGDVDVFVTEWADRPDLNDGNRLYRNDGNGTFTDTTLESGVYNLDLHGFAPWFADMNGDRYPELLVAGDYQSTAYYVNNGDGTFTDMTGYSGIGDDPRTQMLEGPWGMGAAVTDVNNDGLLDWYVTGVYGFEGVPYETDGNFLWINRGADRFERAPETAGVTDGRWGWGTAAVDVDHDGLVDLLETNGYRDRPGVDPPDSWVDPSLVFRNNGDMTFTDVHELAELVHELQGRALLTLDYDRDGDMDVLITTYEGPVHLFRNDVSGPDANWLQIDLDTGSAPGLAPHGLGTRIVVTAGGTRRYFYVGGGANFLGRSELVAHFGLGSAQYVERLVVEWADGSTTVRYHVPVNRRLTLRPQQPPVDFHRRGVRSSR